MIAVGDLLISTSAICLLPRSSDPYLLGPRTFPGGLPSLDTLLVSLPVLFHS